nr:hypothetical protein Itr_chr01CG24090 [Ipomoea trifida]
MGLFAGLGTESAPGEPSSVQRNSSLVKLPIWILNNDSVEAMLHSARFVGVSGANTDDGILYNASSQLSVGDSIMDKFLELELGESRKLLTVIRNELLHH